MIRLLLFLLIASSGAVSAHAEMRWLPVPHKIDMMHMRSAAQMFRLEDADGASVRMMQPDLAMHQIQLNNKGEVSIHPDGKEYFHVLIAKRKTPDKIETAIRYFHLFGRPANVSPEKLTAIKKSDLEIVPAPLPREHWSYLPGQTFDFVLRFKDHPLADHKVDFTSSNGTRLKLSSDARGRVHLRIPDDFHAVRPGFRHNKPAEFLLTLKHSDRGKNYITRFSAAYRADPTHWQSLSGGMLVAGGGMLFGGLLGWRLKKRNQTRTTQRRSA